MYFILLVLQISIEAQKDQENEVSVISKAYNQSLKPSLSDSWTHALFTRLCYLPKVESCSMGQNCVDGGKTAAAAAKSLQSCPTLCDSIDSSPPGSPVPGILQARTLEWAAISFSARHSNGVGMGLSMKRYSTLLIYFFVFYFWFAIVHHHKGNRIRILLAVYTAFYKCSPGS